MYGLLIDLLNKKMSINEELFEQNRMKSKINKLLTSLRNIHAKRFLNNAKKLFDKRKILISAFVNKDIFPGNLTLIFLKIWIHHKKLLQKG